MEAMRERGAAFPARDCASTSVHGANANHFQILQIVYVP